MESQFTREGCQKPLVIVADEAQPLMDRATRIGKIAQLTALLMASYYGPHYHTEQER